MKSKRAILLRAFQFGLLSCLVLLNGHLFAQNWPTSGGDVWRQRTADLPLQTTSLSPTWRLPAPGLPRSMLISEIDGDIAPEVVFAGGGRLRAFESNGALEWATAPFDADDILPPIDFDGDLRPDLIVRRRPSGVAVVRGRDGYVSWQSELADLARVGSVLVDDFDGDGLPDVLFAEYDCGAPGRKIGRAIAYSFSDLQVPVELFRLEEDTREYYCGNNMALADLDGDGRREVIAPSTERVHVYSSSNGAHLGATRDFSPPLPFGVAQAFVEDVDDDGREEVLLLTNNEYPPDNNSRRAMLIEFTGESTDPVISWDLNVDDVRNDRHAWPNEPLVDLDSDGSLEFVHAFFDHTTSAWTTFVRDPRDGRVLHQTEGRPVGIVRRAQQQPWLLMAEVEPDLLVALALGQAGLMQEARFEGDELVTTEAQWQMAGFPRHLARTTASSPYLYVLDNRDRAGQLRAEFQIRAFGVDGVEAGSYAYNSRDRFEGSLVGETTLLAHVDRDSGVVTLLDGKLDDSSMEKSIVSPGQNRQEVLGALDSAGSEVRLGRAHSFYDLSSANLARAAERLTRTTRVLGLLDANSDGHTDWLVFNEQYNADLADLAVLDGVDGTPIWSRDGLVERSSVRTIFWREAAMTDDFTGDTVPEVLVQVDEPGVDSFRMYAIDGATGEFLWSEPFTLASTRGGLVGAPLVFHTDAGPRIATSQRQELYLVDPANGSLLGEGDAGFGCCLSAWPRDSEGSAEILLNARVYGRWVTFDESLEPKWVQDSILREQRLLYTGTGATLVEGSEGRFVVEGRTASLPLDHNLVVLDAQTGSVIHRLELSGGGVHSVDEEPTLESLNAGVGFDASEHGDALYLTSSREGFLYLIRPGADPSDASYPDNVLVRSWNLGAELGDLSAVDVSGDGFSEVLVPTRDGHIIVLDEPAIDMALVVRDTDCEHSHDDVDTITFTDRFCVSWDLPNVGVDGYVVTLVDMESGAPLSSPLDIGSQTSARFDDIRLLEGERYNVRVQAYLGQGTDARVTDVFESDGAAVIDPGEPPVIVGPTADPASFAPAARPTRISATLRDPSPLAAYQLQVVSPDGEVVFDDEGQLNTSEFILERDWAALTPEGESLPLGTYEIVVRATDFSGLTASASGVVELVSTEDLYDVRKPDPGCGCDKLRHHSSVPPGVLWWSALVLLGALGTAWRRV